MGTLVGYSIAFSLAFLAGLACLVLPGLLLATRWMLYAQIVMTRSDRHPDGRGDAFAESVRLLQGHFAAAFGLLLLSFGLSLLSALVLLPVTVPMMIVDPTWATAWFESPAFTLASDLVSTVWNFAVTAVNAVMGLVAWASFGG